MQISTRLSPFEIECPVIHAFETAIAGDAAVQVGERPLIDIFDVLLIVITGL
jgi:hypothetical protein